MTALGEDVLAYLARAVDEAAKDADRWHDRECDVHAISLPDFATLLMAAEVPGAVCDCTGPASVLRRCAADRKLIELHRPQETGAGFPDIQECRTCSADSLGDGYQYLMPAPCPSLLALAEGYGWAEGKSTPCGYAKQHPSHTFMRLDVAFQCPGIDGTECPCASGSPEMYEGPLRNCPIHGARGTGGE